MAIKQQIIQTFKALDFEKLETLLDDDKPYMDVSKDLFLYTLKSKLERHINKGLKAYENVLVGSCGTCNKGCKAYSFVKKDFPSLNLFFEGTEEEVTDIYLCRGIELETEDEDAWEIFFGFYEEDKVNFNPSLSYHTNSQQVNKAIEDFNFIALEPIISIENLVHWHNRYRQLSIDVNANDPFTSIKYRAYEPFDKLHYKIDSLLNFYERNYYAKMAMEEFNSLDIQNEKEIVMWLLNHKRSGLYNTFIGIGNWKKTGFVELDTKTKLIVDCSECIEALLFADLYEHLRESLMQKYEPTKEHYEQNGGSVPCSLESFLRLHKTHLDFLP